jgi:hypothetical protein
MSALADLVANVRRSRKATVGRVENVHQAQVRGALAEAAEVELDSLERLEAAARDIIAIGATHTAGGGLTDAGRELRNALEELDRRRI